MAVKIWQHEKSHYILIVFEKYGLTSRYNKNNGRWMKIQKFNYD